MGGSCRDIQLFRVFIGHIHQLVRWCQKGVNVVKDCPPPDTCKATVGRDQMGGREIIGRSISK